MKIVILGRVLVPPCFKLLIMQKKNPTLSCYTLTFSAQNFIFSLPEPCYEPDNFCNHWSAVSHTEC